MQGDYATMRLVIKKSELLHALQSVQRAVPTRTTKMVLYGILFKADNDKLEISAYDMELGIRTFISSTPDKEENPLQIEEPGEIVLNARYVIEIVKKLPQPLVRIDVQELTTILHSGNATYTLNGMDPREYPVLPEIEQENGLMLHADTLKMLIDHTVFAVSTSEIRPTLTGVLMKYDEGTISFSATDSHRLATHTIEVDVPKDYEKFETIIPGKSLIELNKILPDNDSLINLHLDQNQLLISFDNTFFYSRLVDGNYPDVSRIIPTTFRTTIQLDRKNLIECVERAALLAKDNDNQVIRIQLKPSFIEVTSNSIEIGKITETIEPESFVGENMLIGCNSKFLIEALRALNEQKIKINFTGTGSAFVLNEISNDQHIHLILPVRTGNV
jgi:DNA polymerase-3 subunit beta